MVNAKNAFVGTMLAGIIIAAVGSEKYYSGNWDTMSGDFSYTNIEGRFAPITGRFYAENSAGCSLSETGELSKGSECDLHNGMDYQMEMSNGQYEWFAYDDVFVSTNLETGETVTSKQTKSDNQGDTETNEWTVVDGKLTSKAGTQISVSNHSAPGKKIREMWEALNCGFDVGCWGSYMWDKYTTCDGLFWAFAENIGYCIAWILYMLIMGALVPASAGTSIGGMIVGLSGFYVWCVRGVLAMLVLMLVRCTISALTWLVSQLFGGSYNDFSDCLDKQRQLGGRGGFGSGTGGGYGSGNNPCAGTLDNCRMLGGGCRALAEDPGQGGGGPGGPGPDDCCRSLSRDLGGGCRALGGGGENNCDNNWAPQSDCC